MSKFICKSTDETLQQATFVVLAPDIVDLHGDIYNAKEVAKACHNFNKFCRTANLFHLADTSAFEIAESYIAPADLVLGGQIVPKGVWLAVIQVNSPELWQMILNEEVSGLSIGALAIVEELESY